MSKDWKKLRAGQRAITVESDPYKKKAHQGYLEALEYHHKRSKNPLMAWEAFSVSRKYDMPTPEWILEYFDRVAVNLERCGEQESTTAKTLGRVFEITKRGRGTFFSWRSNLPPKVAIARQVSQDIEAGHKKSAVIFDIAKKTECSETTVRKYYDSVFGPR